MWDGLAAPTSYLTVIGVHEMYGQVYPNYCQTTILFCLHVAVNLPMKNFGCYATTNKYTCTAHVYVYMELYYLQSYSGYTKMAQKLRLGPKKYVPHS